MYTEKKDRKEIFALFCQVFENLAFEIVSGLNPCSIIYKGVPYNVYIKNLTPAQLSNNNPDVWRCQLPKREVFDEYKSSENLFILLGYDAENDVYATWNPYWAKQRLNVGESVSMYSRYSIQKEAAEKQAFLEFDLNHNGVVVVFPRVLLPDYIDKIKSYFAEESTYVAIGSSLRKTTNESVADVKNEMNMPNIETPELIAKIAPLMCAKEPQEMEAMQILFDTFGDKYKDSMQFLDWLRLLRSTDWSRLSGIPQEQVSIDDCSETELSKQTILKVTLPSGKIICHNKSIDTYVDTIEHLYPDLISEMKINLRNAPLVSKARVNERQRELSNGYFLSVCSHTKDLAKVLMTVAYELEEDIVVDIIVKDGVPQSEPIKTNKEFSGERRSSVGFRVIFPDGTMIHSKKGKQTLIETLRLIGLERIFNDALKHKVMYSGYCIVDRKERERPNSKSSYQTFIDGYYIYTHSSHETKVEHLKRLSDFYGLGLTFEWDEDKNEIESGSPSLFENADYE